MPSTSSLKHIDYPTIIKMHPRDIQKRNIMSEHMKERDIMWLGVRDMGGAQHHHFPKYNLATMLAYGEVRTTTVNFCKKPLAILMEINLLLAYYHLGLTNGSMLT